MNNNTANRLKKQYTPEQLKELFISRQHDVLFINTALEARIDSTDEIHLAWLGYEILTNSPYLKGYNYEINY